MLQGQEDYKFQNWARTYQSNPELYFQPTNAEEVRQVLDLARQRTKRVKVVGGAHSPSDIACTDGYLISLHKMNKVLKEPVCHRDRSEKDERLSSSELM
nr:PREDICTED: L-gulonolactone oxidase-like [Latimeria chalumnae]|eukprot:XP_014352699.1 PREDICTED: L-gulonolactone oxidase-like [Latimeria chalumnae]